MSAFEEIIKIKKLLDSGAITQEEFEKLKQEAMEKSVLQGQPEIASNYSSDSTAAHAAAKPKTVTLKKEERSGIKAFGVWFCSAVIIQLIAGTASRYIHPGSRVSAGLVALCMIAMVVIPIVLAVRWKQGKYDSSFDSEKSSWLALSLLASIMLAILVWTCSLI